MKTASMDYFALSQTALEWWMVIEDTESDDGAKNCLAGQIG